MSPASGPVKEQKMFPAATLEDQEALMAGSMMNAVTLSTPPFSSPDPSTDALRMQEIVDLPAEQEGEQQMVAAGGGEEESVTAGELVEQVNAATTQEELDEVVQRYTDSGESWVTVDDAVERKQNQINEQSGE